MKRKIPNAIVSEIMREFARRTGLDPVGTAPRRYLWTDAYAVCNFLELFRQTGDEAWRDLALRLVDQVHRTLGRHRADDQRSGWISGLSEEEGGLHPTRGGLRIGKEQNERSSGAAPDERLEWDRDGQYYHYLTKWMHALHRVSRVTGEAVYARWALELAQAAHQRFCYLPAWGGAKRLYWKMSIDMSRPQVPSMGQHDPLDGMLTCSELQTDARAFGSPALPALQTEIAELAAISRGQQWETDDPLGIGGLLCDASRIAQLMIGGAFREPGLLEKVVDAALIGLELFAADASLQHPAAHRLAFRELGLSIGLKGAAQLRGLVEEHPALFAAEVSLPARLFALERYLPIAERIESFWLNDANQAAGIWNEHRDINTVMLATSLAPEGFIVVLG